MKTKHSFAASNTKKNGARGILICQRNILNQGHLRWIKSGAKILPGAEIIHCEIKEYYSRSWSWKETAGMTPISWRWCYSIPCGEQYYSVSANLLSCSRLKWERNLLLTHPRGRGSQCFLTKVYGNVKRQNCCLLHAFSGYRLPDAVY